MRCNLGHLHKNQHQARLCNETWPQQCPGIPHRGHHDENETCPIDEARITEHNRRVLKEQIFAEAYGQIERRVTALEFMDQAEARIRNYMFGHFSEGTIGGVVDALRGESSSEQVLIPKHTITDCKHPDCVEGVVVSETGAGEVHTRLLEKLETMLESREGIAVGGDTVIDQLVGWLKLTDHAVDTELQRLSAMITRLGTELEGTDRAVAAHNDRISAIEGYIRRQENSQARREANRLIIDPASDV